MTTFHQAAVLGRRYTGEEAKAHGIVNSVAEGSSLVKAATTLAKQHTGADAYDRNNLHLMKSSVYEKVLDQRYVYQQDYHRNEGLFSRL